jgi:murein DD-endopeptidase MepM/ murein hydrolase activator NlpD
MRDSLRAKGKKLKALIQNHRTAFGSVVKPQLTRENSFELHLSNPKNILADVDPTDAEGCWEAIEHELKKTKKMAAIGGYGEKRTAYRINKELFGSEQEERCIHLGIDIWMPGRTPIYAPLDAKVHSFADNASLGNYGPTIILEHKLEDVVFYTLYGHLTRESLSDKLKGQLIKKGQSFATIGWPHENGNWVVHLHYQFMADMLGNEGDFPGVSTEKEADFYLTLCPEPAVM